MRCYCNDDDDDILRRRDPTRAPLIQYQAIIAIGRINIRRTNIDQAWIKYEKVKKIYLNTEYRYIKTKKKLFY